MSQTLEKDLVTLWQKTSFKRSDLVYFLLSYHYGVRYASGYSPARPLPPMPPSSSTIFPSLTLEEVGDLVELTRERVRQIISRTVSGLKVEEKNPNSSHLTVHNFSRVPPLGHALPLLQQKQKSEKYERPEKLSMLPTQLTAQLTRPASGSHIELAAGMPYENSSALFASMIDQDDYIQLEKVLAHPYFSSFKGNHKGFFSFMNDIGVRQAAYRKHVYLHFSTKKGTEIVLKVQTAQRKIKKQKTLERISRMKKSITYIPHNVRQTLLDLASSKNVGLNELYKDILLDFSAQKPYMSTPAMLLVSRKRKALPSVKNSEKEIGKETTGSGKSLSNGNGKFNGKINSNGALNTITVTGKSKSNPWCQVGLYIEKDFMDHVSSEAQTAQTSLMNYVSCAFQWHCTQQTGAV